MKGRKRRQDCSPFPKAVKKTSGIAANLLWDVPAYVFGRPKPDPKKDPAKLAERAVEQQRCFIAPYANASRLLLSDEGVEAVLRFLERGDFEGVFDHPAWPEIEESGANLGFQLEGDTCLVCERPAVIAALTTAGEIPTLATRSVWSPENRTNRHGSIPRSKASTERRHRGPTSFLSTWRPSPPTAKSRASTRPWASVPSSPTPLL